jgi:hypothetical protein
MKDPNYIDTIFRITADGIPIDDRDNYYDTLEEALEGAKSYRFSTMLEYAIAEITTITTIHDLDAQKNLI